MWLWLWAISGLLAPDLLWAQNPRELRVPPDVELRRDVEFGTGGGRPLRLHLLRPQNLAPDQKLPVVVWIHGGAWLGGSRDGGIGRLVPLVRQGFIGASIEYRLSGEAKFPAQIEDCKCAIRYLRAHAKDLQIDPHRIGVAGHSAGGHLAALLGTSANVKSLEGTGGWADQSSAVQAVCDLAGPTDFPGWGSQSHGAVRSLLGGSISEKPELAALASPVTHVHAGVPPFFIQHGEVDDVVPVSQAESLHRSLQSVKADVQLRILPMGDHNAHDASTSRLISEFFAKHLQDKNPRPSPPAAP